METHLGKLETVPPVNSLFHLWCMTSNSLNPSHWSGQQQKVRVKTHQPRSRLHNHHCNRWWKTERQREKKIRWVFKMGFAEGSHWNIHHTMLFFWEPTAVSRGAGVEKRENTLLSHREIKLKYCAGENGEDTTEETALLCALHSDSALVKLIRDVEVSWQLQ